MTNNKPLDLIPDYCSYAIRLEVELAKVKAELAVATRERDAEWARLTWLADYMLNNIRPEWFDIGDNLCAAIDAAMTARSE